MGICKCYVPYRSQVVTDNRRGGLCVPTTGGRRKGGSVGSLALPAWHSQGWYIKMVESSNYQAYRFDPRISRYMNQMGGGCRGFIGCRWSELPFYRDLNGIMEGLGWKSRGYDDFGYIWAV